MLCIVAGLTGPWYTEGIVGLGASLDIDIWGKQRAQIAASLGVSNARLAETSAVELELSTDVAQLYYGIQTTYELIAWTKPDLLIVGTEGGNMNPQPDWSYVSVCLNALM